jgi:Tol biopolymer transport system component
MITWSVGTIGHVHSIWSQRVGLTNDTGTYQLNSGDNVEAVYNRAGNNGIGSWLVVTAARGLPGDVLSVTVDGLTQQLTRGKQVSFAQWSPNGMCVDYFDGLASGFGAFHITNIATGEDTLVANTVMNTPLPAWSMDSQQLAYSTGTHVLVMQTQGISKSSHPLKLQGPATALSWSEDAPNHLVTAMSDGEQGIYLVDTQHDTWLQLDTSDLNGPIFWTQIP